MNSKLRTTFALSTLLFFAMAFLIESSAWARAGGGRSMGSRGSKSFSTPQSPSGPALNTPGMSTPGRNPGVAGSAQPSGGFFSRSPFLQGLAGGLAGGMIGSLLFGGMGHAATGGTGGGGIGFLELALIGLLLYFGYRFFKRRREQAYANASAYSDASPPIGSFPGSAQYQGPYAQEPAGSDGNVDRGIQQIRTMDPGFDEEKFKETVQDLFFRIQAGWTNRSLDGIGGILTDEMAGYFHNEFNMMNEKGVINRLENIAVRKVELSEAWQEAGKDFVTVLFTANLLDYTVDAATREVVDGDRMNPVKFQEFWTFCRDVGTFRWQLSAISQVQSQ
jgi:predicted lipid-binding transport protein (Tim44 family)